MFETSSVDRRDPKLKRLMYLRYADDFVILISGSYKDALKIKRHVKDFLKQHTGLELNVEKTKITPTRAPFPFLGATCKRVHRSIKLTKNAGTNIRRRTTPRLRVDIPTQRLVDNFLKAGFLKRNRRGSILTTSRTDLTNLDHDDIIRFYNAKINGIISYYSFARNY